MSAENSPPPDVQMIGKEVKTPTNFLHDLGKPLRCDEAIVGYCHVAPFYEIRW